MCWEEMKWIFVYRKHIKKYEILFNDLLNDDKFLSVYIDARYG